MPLDGVLLRRRTRSDEQLARADEAGRPLELARCRLDLGLRLVAFALGVRRERRVQGAERLALEPRALGRARHPQRRRDAMHLDAGEARGLELLAEVRRSEWPG
jgi:hypothetical protein